MKGVESSKINSDKFQIKKSGRKIVLLHLDSSESEEMNQLALIESQLFFDPVVVGPVLDEEAGEVKVPTNKLSNDIRHLASSLLVTKEAEPPRKEVLKAFLASERKCTLDKETREWLCTILDNYDQDGASFSHMETLPSRTDQSTKNSHKWGLNVSSK